MEILQIASTIFLIITEFLVVGLLGKMYYNISKHNKEITSLKDAVKILEETIK